MTLPRCHVETGRARESAAWGRVLLTMLLLCLPDGPAHAGWTTFTTADGLAARRVNALLQDSSGVLWFATDGGVSRYDGERWTAFTPGSGPAGSHAHSVYQDRSGAIWCGTWYGASRYAEDEWTTYTTADGLAGNTVASILQDGSGAFWFATDKGASRYDGVRWTTFTTAQGLVDDEVVRIFEDHSGALWFGTRRGASRYDGTRWTTFALVADYYLGEVVSIFQDATGAVWLGTDDGAYRYDGTRWTRFSEEDGLPPGYVYWILQDDEGAFWFGTEGGVCRYDGKAWTRFTTVDGLANDLVLSALRDVSGAFWFGTGDGLSRYDGERWNSLSTIDSLYVGGVFSITQDTSGDLWFGHGYGMSRYDGTRWTNVTTPGGSADNGVWSMLQDDSGALWCGTRNGGVSRYDGERWTTFTPADGLASNRVRSMLQDASGAIWVGTFDSGVSRYDGQRWTTFTTVDGLAGNWVTSMLQDASGALWFGTPDGVSRYDGQRWRSFTTADGLAANSIASMMQDDSGALWFGTGWPFAGGVSRYDGEEWTTFTTVDGLADDSVHSILQDESGVFWFGTGGGVTRFDGERWATFTVRDGLIDEYVSSMLFDRKGDLWIGTSSGLGLFSPDHVPPETLILDPPHGASASRIQSLTAVAAYGETRGIDFSYSLDDGPWSEWSGRGSLTLELAFPGDGRYTVRVRTRDLMGNIDPTPAAARFEIDGTPPTPILTSPASGQAVRDTLSIAGTAIDARFQSYTLRYASADGALVGTLATSTAPATEELLARWNTATVPDGVYELRLSVTDTLRLTGTAVVPIVVDNAFPPADQTSPASVTATAGGDVYTTHREAHVYFPPNAFARDATVTIVPADSALVPEMLPGDIPRVLPAYRISWTGSDLCKPAVLEMAVPAVGSLGGSSPPEDPRDFAVYHAIDGSSWERLGGTLAAADARISATITMPGLYALYLEDTAPPGSRSLSTLTLSPRVLSPLGGSSGQGVAIGFRLGCASPVTVKVYNRAGRLIRRVLHGETLGPGSNLIRWDARDDDGGVIPDGIYLLTVESRGERLVKSIAVAK